MRPAIAVYGLFIVFGLVIAAFFPFLAIYLAGRGLSPDQIGLVIAAMAAARLLFLPVWGHVADTTIGRLTTLQVGASIRVNDSLYEGSSRFYAEITRLRQLFEPSSLPLLFLLDELLQGTNSNDRRIGAQGVLRALIDRGAIGLVSTHDLALADGAQLRPGALKNVHFQDQLEKGRLSFDFKLRDGVVTKSNGVELMRAIGLDV